MQLLIGLLQTAADVKRVAQSFAAAPHEFAFLGFALADVKFRP
jgi:hypothetical protein